jgi:hypothetical protein
VVCQPRAANKRLAQELEILKSYCHLQHPADLVSCYKSIAHQRSSYPVRLLCRVLGVMPGCYYAWEA